MPVRKYRRVEDMPSALFRPPLDPMNIRLACDLSAAARAFARARFPPGVYRHRSLEDARRLRDEWERGGTER
jgi:hypothetical protein